MSSGNPRKQGKEIKKEKKINETKGGGEEMKKTRREGKERKEKMWRNVR